MMCSEEFYMEIKKKWKSLYPAYFDKSKTITQGRRVPQNLAVDDPTVQEIASAITQLRHKSYPKDWTNIGRFKVQLLDDNKKPTNAAIKNKNQLLKAIGQRLVNLRSQNKSPKK